MFAFGVWITKAFYPAHGGALVDPNGHLQKIASFEANMFPFLVVTMLSIVALGLAAWIWRAKS